MNAHTRAYALSVVRSRWLVLVALLFTNVALAQQRPFVADPMHAYLVEGRVVDEHGRGVPGVVVERMSDASGSEPFSRGAYRETTDRRGAFRFEFSALGWGTGRTWYLAAHRAGCSDARATVELQREDRNGRAIDVARGALIRLPPCAPHGH